MKRLALLIGILAIGAAESLPAGGGQEGTGPVTIHFMTPEVELSPQLVERFVAANPDIELVRIEEDYTRLVAELAAGTPRIWHAWVLARTWPISPGAACCTT